MIEDREIGRGRAERGCEEGGYTGGWQLGGTYTFKNFDFFLPTFQP